MLNSFHEFVVLIDSKGGFAMRHLRYFYLPETISTPSVLPVTRTRDDWYVPSKEGIREETEPVVEVVNHKRIKINKVTKTILIVLGVAAFLVLSYYFYRDFLNPNLYNYKIY